MLALLVGLLGAGCGGAEPVVSTPTSSAAAQHDLKPAAGEAILTFSGLVNEGRPLAVDLASLGSLPTQSLTVVEPFLMESMTFTGVAFADLLDAARATGQSVTIHALDDYEVTLAAAVLREPGVMLATHVDGEAIEVASGGPVRLVFPPSSESGKDSDLWVWSIDQITVE